MHASSIAVFGQERRRVMSEITTKFRDDRLLLPARIGSEVAANLLGQPDRLLSSMTEQGIIASLGEPRKNGCRRYYAPYILALRRNVAFLDQSESYAHEFWKRRRTAADQRESMASEEWERFSPKPGDVAHLQGMAVPLEIDPVVDIGAAEVLLGFASYDLRILIHAGVLREAGAKGTRCGHKRFHFEHLLDCYRDALWVDRAERAVTGHWRRKNARNVS